MAVGFKPDEGGKDPKELKENVFPPTQHHQQPEPLDWIPALMFMANYDSAISMLYKKLSLFGLGKVFSVYYFVIVSTML